MNPLRRLDLNRRDVQAGLVLGGMVALYAFIDLLFPIVFDAFWPGACTVGEALGTRMLCNPFLQRGLTTGLFIGLAGPLIGAYLVNRQMALIGEALAHTAFTGVAIGLVLGNTVEWANFPLVTAVVVAAIAALGLQYLASHTDAYGDVPIAILLVGSFALGIAIISRGYGFGATINSYLFGNVLTVQFHNVQLMAALSLVVVGVVALTHKQLLYITFDREAARLARVNVDVYDTLLIVLTALVVVASIQVLGAILVAAMLVVPVAAAMQLTDSFGRMMWLSVLIGEVAVLGGVVVSYQWDIATGAMIVLVAIAIYLLSLLD
ncbi:metal ABC transporter permease [Halorubrum luteum]